MVIVFRVHRKGKKDPEIVVVDCPVTEEEIVEDMKIVQPMINAIYDDIHTIEYHPAHNFYTKKDCVQCGFCCMRYKCQLGAQLYGFEGICEALEWDGEKYVCKQFDKLDKFGELGTGCNCNLNRWRDKVERRKYR